MTKPVRSWQEVQTEVLRRIHAREWPPGSLIPNETDLAQEFGCARATVNRALRTVAENGLLDRRRKAGTRVALQPAAKATLTIPVIRQEVEDRGQRYGYRLLSRTVGTPPPEIVNAMQVPSDAALLHLRALHLSDDAPYAIEDRWINLEVVPAARDVAFDKVSGNEWLLVHAPFTHGQISFSAATASVAEADDLNCKAGSALFVLERLTWDRQHAITQVNLSYAPGHRMQTQI